MPAYQAAAHLEQTLASVWAQDFEDFELVVVEDGSSDCTADVLATQGDPRLRLFRHRRNLGQAQTVAETVAHARADLVKFLDSDDLLRRDCLGRMVEALDAHPDASFAFCRRDLLVERPEDAATRDWIERFGELHGAFGRLGEINDGRLLLRRYLDGLLADNWVAEPAGVMARRADVVAVGGYNRRLRQNNDVDLWVRLMARGNVVFIDEPLYTYRLAFSGVTGNSTARPTPGWADPLWTVQGLAELDWFPERDAVRSCRRRLLSVAARRTAKAPFHDPGMARAHLKALVAYGRHRLARRLGAAQSLYTSIELDAAAR